MSDICLVLLGHNHNLLVEYMVVLDFSLSLLHQVFEAKFLVLKGKCHLALDILALALSGDNHNLVVEYMVVFDEVLLEVDYIGSVLLVVEGDYIGSVVVFY